jgi:adenine phosphoribosyltransferase
LYLVINFYFASRGKIPKTCMKLEEKVKRVIRDVKDYPKPGIIFKDITPVLANPRLVKEIVKALADPLKNQKIDAIAAVEARGFIFGAMLAQELQCAFIPVRKSGKLPFDTIAQDYALEYGTASIEIHNDALQAGWKVVVHDDLLATGGTAAATAKLIKRLGGEVTGFSFFINLTFLQGGKVLEEEFGIAPNYVVTY